MRAYVRVCLCVCVRRNVSASRAYRKYSRKRIEKSSNKGRVPLDAQGSEGARACAMTGEHRLHANVQFIRMDISL